jgi:3',5'-cyclic AMP phosphodiesterase CpdA
MTTLIKTLVQLSDPHIKLPGARAYGRVDTAQFLRQAVQAVLRLKQPPHAVVVTGDLTDFGRADEYAHLRELLQPIGCPLYLLPGNHDEREGLRAAFPEHGYLRNETPFIQYAVDLGGLRLVAVDTVVPYASHGEVCAERIDQLAHLLAQDTATPTIVAMHHPPFRTLIGHMDDIGLRNPAALEAVVARHPQVRRVICGHLHRPIQALWANTLAMTAPSTAHQVCLDLADDAPSAFTMEPPGFLVHAWTDTGDVVSHVVPVGPAGPFEGPFPFHEDDGQLID